MIPSTGNQAWDLFLELTDGSTGSFLEMGTKRSKPAVSTHSKRFFPKASRYVLSDFENGLDVDVVADIHRLTASFGLCEFDVFLSNATLEHVERPWVAVEEIWKVLKPGGLCFIQTHQTFPIHGYPQDYWRFTDKAMLVLFSGPGWEPLKVSYQYPCKIVPPEEVAEWNQAARSFLNVNILARKPG